MYVIDIQTFVSLFFATIAIVISVISLKRSATRLANSKLSRSIDMLQIELTEQSALIGSLTQQMKRFNARVNMQKAREKKRQLSSNGGDMSDDEWRKWATKRIQQGQPIE